MSPTRKFSLTSNEQLQLPDSPIDAVSGSVVQKSDDKLSVVFQLNHTQRHFSIDDMSEPTVEKHHTFTLAPPAAAQLARDLDSVVQEYLYYEETELH